MQVSVLLKAKLENRVAMTMALVTVALVISFIPMTVVFILGDYFQLFRGLLAWRVVETLVYLNSIASPLIYCYRDRLFRIAVLEILRIKKPKAKQFPVGNAVPFVRSRATTRFVWFSEKCCADPKSRKLCHFNKISFL